VWEILCSRSCSSYCAGKETYIVSYNCMCCLPLSGVLSFSLQTAVEASCCWSTWYLHSESLNCVQEKDKLPGHGPCKWPWFELLDELTGGSPKQSRIGSARKQARFLRCLRRFLSWLPSSTATSRWCAYSLLSRWGSISYGVPYSQLLIFNAYLDISGCIPLC
jgi:hypothetical protein